MASLALSFASKKEDESGLSSYYNNKTTIIQEARVFNDSPISPRKCRALLTRIVYLLYVGETFGTQEATTLFFGTTKLFQHKDVSDNMEWTNVPLSSFLASLERPQAGRLPRYQGTRHYCRRCYHGHQQHHERYAAEF